MFKVVVSSLKDKFSDSTFESIERAQEYIERHTMLKTWGESGDFTADIIDITSEVEALKAKEASKLAYEETLKTKVQTWQNLSSKDKDKLFRNVVAKVLGVEFER